VGELFRDRVEDREVREVLGENKKEEEDRETRVVIGEEREVEGTGITEIRQDRGEVREVSRIRQTDYSN
jgi:hypothetical protein